MKYFSSILCISLIVCSFGFAKEVQLEKKVQNSVIYNNEVFDVSDTPIHLDPPQTREQIDLIVEDFEALKNRYAQKFTDDLDAVLQKKLSEA